MMIARVPNGDDVTWPRTSLLWPNVRARVVSKTLGVITMRLEKR
jgi:hypothetical protein